MNETYTNDFFLAADLREYNQADTWQAVIEETLAEPEIFFDVLSFHMEHIRGTSGDAVRIVFHCREVEMR